MPAPARPYWTGFLKLSLVTIAVRLYTATTERDRVRFHQIHEPSGERVKQQLVVPGHGPVERDEIVKGYEYEKGHYVTVDPDDIKRLRLETTDTIDIVEFVDDIDPIYFDTPYYLVPDGSVAEEGYRVIREALRESNKIAVGRVVINGQERTVAIRPLGTGLFGNSVRYADEVRNPEDYFRTIAEDNVDDDQRAIMEQIIKRKTREFDPANSRPLPGGAARTDRREARRQIAAEAARAQTGPSHQPDGRVEAQPGRGGEPERAPPKRAASRAAGEGGGRGGRAAKTAARGRKPPRRPASATCCCRCRAAATRPPRQREEEAPADAPAAKRRKRA